MHDLADGVARDAEVSRDALLLFASSHAEPYGVDLFGVQLLKAPRALPPLSNRVQMVVAMGSNEQMVWIHATRVVAAVANFLSERDGPARHPPRKPMRHRAFVLEAEHAIAARADVAGPQPTGFRISSLDFRPETRENGRPICQFPDLISGLPSETATSNECYVNLFVHGFPPRQPEPFRPMSAGLISFGTSDVPPMNSQGCQSYPRWWPQLPVLVGARR